jgi:hypothetical protein
MVGIFALEIKFDEATGQVQTAIKADKMPALIAAGILRLIADQTEEDFRKRFNRDTIRWNDDGKKY